MMAWYRFDCPYCSNFSIDDKRRFGKETICPTHNKPMSVVTELPKIERSTRKCVQSFSDIRYDCPITGRHITSKKAHEENLAIHGCRVVEKGENELIAKTRAEADKVLESEVHAQIDADFARMTSEQKQTLANELTV